MKLVDPRRSGRGKTPTANFSGKISCVEARNSTRTGGKEEDSYVCNNQPSAGSSFLVLVSLQVLGMGLSGQVQIRRNRKIASYLLSLANHLSQGLGTS